MKNTKDAIVTLKNGKTVHGIVIEQNIQPDNLVFINYKNIEQVGKIAINSILEFIPLKQVFELDYCTK